MYWYTIIIMVYRYINNYYYFNIPIIAVCETLLLNSYKPIYYSRELVMVPMQAIIPKLES